LEFFGLLTFFDFVDFVVAPVLGLLITVFFVVLLLTIGVFVVATSFVAPVLGLLVTVFFVVLLLTIGVFFEVPCCSNGDDDDGPLVVEECAAPRRRHCFKIDNTDDGNAVMIGQGGHQQMFEQKRCDQNYWLSSFSVVVMVQFCSIV